MYLQIVTVIIQSELRNYSIFIPLLINIKITTKYEHIMLRAQKRYINITSS